MHIPTLRPSDRNPTRGFSLIELAVVVAIVGILAAVAIVTFLGQREGAQDRQAHSSLRNTITVGRAAAAGTDNSNFPGTSTADLVGTSGESGTLTGDEPSLTYTGAASTDPDTVSVNRLDAARVVYATESASGVCWVVLDDLAEGTFFAAFDGACDAALANVDGTASGSEWDLDSDGDPSNGYDGMLGSFAAAGENESEGPPAPPPLTQAEVLAAFYDSTGGGTDPGDTWTGVNWEQGASGDPCTWEGVSCSSGDVVDVTLVSKNLSGTLPTELGQLTTLTSLYLLNNNITGSIPASFGNLTNLGTLYLDDNSLAGVVPTEVQNMSALSTLFLDGNGCITAEDDATEIFLDGFVTPGSEYDIACQDERPGDALLAFRDSLTPGAQYAGSTVDNWGPAGTDHCSWDGISCTAGAWSLVDRIDIEGAGGSSDDVYTAGTVPAEFNEVIFNGLEFGAGWVNFDETPNNSCLTASATVQAFLDSETNFGPAQNWC